MGWLFWEALGWKKCSTSEWLTPCFSLSHIVCLAWGCHMQVFWWPLWIDSKTMFKKIYVLNCWSRVVSVWNWFKQQVMHALMGTRSLTRCLGTWPFLQIYSPKLGACTPYELGKVSGGFMLFSNHLVLTNELFYCVQSWSFTLSALEFVQSKNCPGWKLAQ